MSEAEAAPIHVRLFDVAEAVDQIAAEIDDPHDRRIAEGAAWDLESLAKIQRDIRRLTQ